MNNLKISTQLITLIGVLSALLLIVGLIGLSGISSSNASLKTVYQDRTIPMQQLNDIRRLWLRDRLAIAYAVLGGTPAAVKTAVDEIESNGKAIDKLWTAYMATYLTPTEAGYAKQIAEGRERFEKQAIAPAVAALRAGEFDRVKAMLQEVIEPAFVPIRGALNDIIALQTNVAEEEYEAAVARYTAQRAVSIASITLGILFGVAVGWIMVRNISGSMAQAMAMANRIAQGDLTQEIKAKGKNEFALLMTTFGAMQGALRGLVVQVRQGSESVATASAQIAQGNHDLSTRTENQASALEETAASMEQLGSAVRQNADNARTANQLAMSASTVASQGGDVVAEVVATMKGINDSSGKISDIIGVIDGIAFQTNILALNAAVEAARAGEQGRGFAVVAAEVRNLAQRSAQAAKEIKGLITDSVERVGRGSALVDRAGVTMTEVVDGIRRVTDIMGEISAATGEQSSGVAQVGEAVIQMDHNTQQNAALVEQMAAAATSLKNQAVELVQAVGFFRVSPGTEQTRIPMGQEMFRLA